MNNFIKDTSTLIIVVSDKEGFLRKLGSKIKKVDYYLIDIGIACEHLVLQATELGLGSCWIGWFDEKKLKKILGVTGNKRIDIIIALGYCNLPSPISQRKELSQIVSFNKIKG